VKTDERLLRERVSGEITYFVMTGEQTFTEDGFKELLRSIVKVADTPLRRDDFDEWLSNEVGKVRRGVRLWLEGGFDEDAFQKAVAKACEFPEAIRMYNTEDLAHRVCVILKIPQLGWNAYDSPRE
jgi:hypothetical protein